jgi:hypothetical protein
MRFGRILLAVLAPLLSVSPGVKADATPENHALAVDSLLNLLRSVVPAAVSAQDAADSGAPQGSHAALSLFRQTAAWTTPVLDWSPATRAALRLIPRLQQRTLLRC